MVTYKYHFEDYCEDVDRIISYGSMKIEIEIVVNYLIIFILYLFTITVYFLYRNKKNKGKFNLIITILSVLLLVFCSLELINYMIEYKYKIEQNFDQSNLVVSYKSRKIEIELIMNYLKIFIAYLLIITGFFMYRLFHKINQTKACKCGLLFLIVCHT
jgi:cytochrome bd-type quinol oxidase subunit 1